MMMKIRYTTKIQKRFLGPALLGLAGGHKVRPYDLDHDWGSNEGADILSAQMQEGK